MGEGLRGTGYQQRSVSCRAWRWDRPLPVLNRIHLSFAVLNRFLQKVHSSRRLSCVTKGCSYEKTTQEYRPECILDRDTQCAVGSGGTNGESKLTLNNLKLTLTIYYFEPGGTERESCTLVCRDCAKPISPLCQKDSCRWAEGVVPGLRGGSRHGWTNSSDAEVSADLWQTHQTNRTRTQPLSLTRVTVVIRPRQNTSTRQSCVPLWPD